MYPTWGVRGVHICSILDEILFEYFIIIINSNNTYYYSFSSF